jgi:hypothetical protein
MCGIELAKSMTAEFELCLQARERRLYEELKNYPTPITACDQQFNYLLEQQANVAQELARLDHSLVEATTQGDVERLAALIRSSTSIDESTKQRLLCRWPAGQ